MTTVSIVLTRAQVRAADEAAVRRLGIPTLALMENAGRGLADVTESTARLYGCREVLVVAARGSNGGDGLVAARHLRLRGLPVRVLLASPPGSFPAGSDAARNLDFARTLGIHVDAWRGSPGRGRPAAGIGPGTLLVDAVLGTGLEGAIRPPLDAVLAWMGSCGLPVVAADLPSGLDADTGDCLGPVPRCVATATFLALKPGLLRGQGPERAGRVTVCDIGVPLEALLGSGSVAGARQPRGRVRGGSRPRSRPRPR